MTKKLILMDGNSILYRAFFALPLLNNDKGVYTNAVYGFSTILLKMLEEEQPTHMLVAFDAGKTTFRHETYKEYKGGRQKTPPELSEQFPIVKELLNAFGISHYELDQYEADDIIGTMAEQAKKNDFKVKIISGDRDLLQLVDDSVEVAVTKKGISNVETYTPSDLKEKIGIRHDQVIDMKALMGDSSDNIPGVPGVGEKTAVKLLNQFGTVEELFEHLDEVSGKKLKENLMNHKEEAFMSKELVTINRHSPVKINLDDLTYKGYENRKVLELFKDLGFQSLLERIESNENEKPAEILSKLDYLIPEDITEDMFTGKDAFVLEMLDENYHYGKILGFAVVNETGKYFFKPETALQSDVFKKWAEDESNEKYLFDAKKITVALKNKGIDLRGITFDLLLASYLVNPAENHHDIPSISHRLNEKDISYDEEIYGKGAKQKVPELKTLSEHVVRKADMLLRMKDRVIEQLKENQQYELFHELELPLAGILGDMEHEGVTVDTNRLEKMGEDLKNRLDQIEKEIHELAGTTFNLNSPKQLSHILFEKLNLPVIKKTKTGYSTSAEVLEQLKPYHEIIPKILMYRQLGKLYSTYIEGLLKVVDQADHKIHTRFNQALTQTGRLSSTDPNLQNIPIRLEEGRKIRQAFVPSHKGWVIFAADYSQIELRVLAHVAGDEKLIQAFRDDMDIHTKTAMDIFHVDKDEVDSNMRRQAKAVNFGIVYGISDYGLSQNLGITRKEAQKFIDRYFESYPGVKNYMDEIVQEAKQKGYVTTIMKRRRYLPDITSRNFNRRSFAERTAMNTPIQGSAADIIKIAMIHLNNRLRKEQMKAKMLLQVHDELILEAPEEEVVQLEQVVREEMEEAVQLKVPLKVDTAYGPTWYDAK
ncbi:DNA polymerase I [Melghiribacillus thermohalophilus]|uniref:DNA polymerase I n=1 Tax=Melghiribacillus thermohalophilus TaxID=1324956 RepID=A0A4R3N9N8_9BACI|nr:DNA polymerase I [Melghiribacillus thermohalophilus]TCT24996.1 DNA polymerase I [Melghiribacillus thermohalophilus]